MKKGLFAGVLCVLLGSILVLRGEREFPDQARADIKSFLEDVTIVQSREGAAVWTLTAKRADVFEEQGKASLRAIALTIPDNNLTLYADGGTYDFTTKSFSTASIVEAKGDGYRITAESLDVDLSSGVIHTQGPIRLDGKRFSLEGRGMEASRGETVRIAGDVRATFEK